MKTAQPNVTQLFNILERNALVREFIGSNLFCSHALKTSNLITTASQPLCEAYVYIKPFSRFIIKRVLAD